MSENRRPPRNRQPEDSKREQRGGAPSGQQAQRRPSSGQGEGRVPVRPQGGNRPRGAAPRLPGKAPRRQPVTQEQMDEYNFLKKAQLRKAQRKRQRIVLLVAAALLVVGVFAIKMAFDLGAGANSFYEGITIDGLKMSSFTKEEAKTQLELANAERVRGMTIKLQYESREWTISPEQMGVSINIDEVIEEAWALGHEGNIFARQSEINRLKKEGEAFRTELTYDEAYLRQQLEAIKDAVDTPAIDATVTFDPEKEEQFRITPEQNGRSLDVDSLYEQVVRQLDNGFTTTIEIKPDVVTPNLYAETLQQCTERIVRVTTDLGSSSDERIHNVKTALAFFNGMIVQPGQEVSFNETTGERGLEQGYLNAGVIQDDEIVDGPGGGVCQVSTTLYHAVVKAGLEIIRSNKHSMAVSYVDVGTDAAVAWDYKDLVFKNNTDYPIFIEGKVSGKTVVVAIYGYPLEEGLSYEIVSDVYETIPAPEPEVVLDTKAEYVTYTDETYEKKKSRAGTKVRSYRVTKMNGEETDRELLRDDYYKEVTGIIYQGVTTRPEGEVPAEGADQTGGSTDQSGSDGGEE